MAFFSILLFILVLFFRTFFYPHFVFLLSIVMVFGLFKKKEKNEDTALQPRPAQANPTSPSEAAITAWCRKNISSSGTAKLFFELVDNGMPLFSSDDEAVSWLSEHTISELSAATVLGLMYEEGLGVIQSYDEAVRLYKLSADQGHTQAQCNLGNMYYIGRGVPQSDSEAVAWFRRAAEQGNVTALCNLGLMYRNGRGVPQSDSEAVAWFRRAAEQGYVTAQYNLGLMYRNGRGVPQSDSEAVAWFRRAAEQGHSQAQYCLGHLYLNGIGVSKSESESLYWFKRAEDESVFRSNYSISHSFYNNLIAYVRVLRDEPNSIPGVFFAGYSDDANNEYLTNIKKYFLDMRFNLDVPVGMKKDSLDAFNSCIDLLNNDHFKSTYERNYRNCADICSFVSAYVSYGKSGMINGEEYLSRIFKSLSRYQADYNIILSSSEKASILHDINLLFGLESYIFDNNGKKYVLMEFENYISDFKSKCFVIVYTDAFAYANFGDEPSSWREFAFVSRCNISLKQAQDFVLGDIDHFTNYNVNQESLAIEEITEKFVNMQEKPHIVFKSADGKTGFSTYCFTVVSPKSKNLRCAS